MNNNYDPNQQPAYQQQPQQPAYQQQPQQPAYQQPQYEQPAYQQPQQPAYQQPQYEQPQPQYQQYQQPAYQAPLYEQKPAIDPKPILIMAIIGLALGATAICTIAGIILSAIAMSKVKAYVAAGNELAGSAKVAKILSTIGLWVSIAMTVIVFIYVIIICAGAAAGSSYYYY